MEIFEGKVGWWAVYEKIAVLAYHAGTENRDGKVRKNAQSGD
jgi:hypothetical protein